MNKRFLLSIVTSLLLILTLAACGDTATSGPSTVATATTVASGATTANTTTTAGPTAGGAMGAMTMQPGQTMGGMSGGTDPMTASLQNLSGQDFEIKFMQDMIAHHQGAVDMAKLVPTHTTRPELLKLSQDIIASQSSEITQMTGWLASWYNAKPLASSMDAPGMMDMMGGMNNLQAAQGANFDKLFIQMMVPHHQSAIAMAKLLPGKTQRPELLKLGQDIINSQSAEVTQMQGWQRTWFNS